MFVLYTIDDNYDIDGNSNSEVNLIGYSASKEKLETYIEKRIETYNSQVKENDKIRRNFGKFVIKATAFWLNNQQAISGEIVNRIGIDRYAPIIASYHDPKKSKVRGILWSKLKLPHPTFDCNYIEEDYEALNLKIAEVGEIL